MLFPLCSRTAKFVFLVLAAFTSTLPAKEKWLAGRSPHFEMMTSGSERDARLLLSELEQFRSTFLSVFSLPPAHELRTQIVLFDSESQFKKYAPLFNGKPRDGAGFFMGRVDQFTIVMQSGRDVEQTCELIFHEYVHQLLYSRGIRPPPWLNEGLAELYSTFKLMGDTAEIGHPKPHHVFMLSRGSLMPLGELFSIKRDSPDYNEGTRRGLFYAQSWALLHMWMCGGDRQYQAKLANFMDAVDAEAHTTPETFKAAFGIDYEEMQSRLRSYLSGGRYLVRIAKIPPSDLKKSIRLQVATDLERDVVLLDLGYRTRKFPESQFRLLDLAERHPAAPRPMESLAMIALHEDGPRAALDFWKKAVERRTDNAYAYLQVAAPQARALFNASNLEYRLPPEIAAEQRAWLDRAIELSPHYGEAHEYLALVEAFSEKPRVAVVNEIQKHVDEVRDRSRILVALAIVRWRLGDAKTASQIARALDATPKLRPPVRRFVRMLQKRLGEQPASRTEPGEEG